MSWSASGSKTVNSAVIVERATEMFCSFLPVRMAFPKRAEIFFKRRGSALVALLFSGLFEILLTSMSIGINK